MTIELRPARAGEIPEPLAHQFRDPDGTPIAPMSGTPEATIVLQLNDEPAVEHPCTWENDTATATYQWGADDLAEPGILQATIWVGNGVQRYASDEIVLWIMGAPTVGV